MAGEWVATFVAPAHSPFAGELPGKLAALKFPDAVIETRVGAVDVFFPGLPAVSLNPIANDLGADCLCQPVATRRKKLLVADMESTIIEQEMLDELAETIGLRDKVANITARAMNGELDFQAALRERVALLRGLPECVLNDVATRITLMPGAEALLRAMKTAGASAWLVSGGFTCFAQPVADRLGFDRVYANELLVKDGVITGEVGSPILDKNSKRGYWQQACAELGIRGDETATIGDGANDVPMLAACNEAGGLGVAFRAKPNVRAVVPNQINIGHLDVLRLAQGL